MTPPQVPLFARMTLKMQEKQLLLLAYFKRCNSRTTRQKRYRVRYGIERHVELPHSIQENHSPRTSLCSPTLKLSKLYCLGGFSMIGHCQWNFGWGLKSQPCNCVLTFLVVSLSPEAIKEPFIQESAHQAHQRHSWLSGGSKGFRRSAGSRDKDYFFIQQSLRTSKKPKKQKTVLATHFYFSPVKPILDFWPPDQFVMF